jgi:spore coat protein A, manganese oxidase
MNLAQKKLTRKELLKLGLLGSAALMLPLERTAKTALAAPRLTSSQVAAITPFRVPLPIPPVLQPVRSDDIAGVDPSSGIPFSGTDYYQVTMKASPAKILPGYPDTMIYGYNGITPGPTIKARQGRQAVVRQINGLPNVSQFNYPSWTSVHLHGSASLPQYDGYASDVTNPGEYKDYVYPNVQPSRTLWYHDHGVHHTAQNAYMGLAAQYHLHDAVEDSLPIPKSHGRYDIPLTIRDAIFDTAGQLVYDDDGESNLFGDVVLANGAPWPVMKVERRKYRFRILNASISRSYRYQLSTGQPMWVIATDGGLMPATQQVQSFRHGAAERYEVIIDFAQNKIGDKVTLQNLSNPSNVNFNSTRQIMRFDVVSEAQDLTDNTIPANPSAGYGTTVQPAWAYDPMKLGAAQAVRTRQIEFGRSGGHGWTINGTTWEDVIASDYKFAIAKPAAESVEIWELVNDSGGWFHPVHIHLIDFKVISRNGGPNKVLPYEKGPKDTVYVGENEKVKVLIRFGPQKGRYMMHCHNLVHEDHDMMTQFWVDEPNGDHPTLAAPAQSQSQSQPL